jgi:hypothetical protein
MAAPNIVNVLTITGKTAVLSITTSATAIVSNAGSSNTLLKINTLIISNVDGTNNADVTVDVYRSSTAYRLSYLVTVPAKSSLDLLSKQIYLEEGDSLRLTASANSRLEGVCSYEIIA